ncbi:hypothetical protein, partial [Polaribacter sp. 11A2H]|uniref:hypothetical protein n=1 Tax=Polaribacter sp. 11A2H TaxID=2687290 RepID=UPI00197C89F6
KKKKNHNYTAFFEDMQEEINFYKTGDDDYCNTMNMCVEALLEMGNYEECYKYAIYNYEQGKLLPYLKPLFNWICFYTFLKKPEDIGDVTSADLIDNPTTFIAYRNNGFIQWMLGDNTAGSVSLKMAAELSSNKACYLKLALICLDEGFDKTSVLALCEDIKKEVPEAKDWQLGFDYANLLKGENRHKEASVAYKDLLQSYPNQSFVNLPKDEYNVMLRVFKDFSKGLNDVEGFTKYNAMYLSKDNPSEDALLEQLEVATTNYKEDVFLQYNLLVGVSKLDLEFENGELEMLKELKLKIRNTYFA